jgi:hypothetical protein
MLKHFLFVSLLLFTFAAHAGRILPPDARIGQINGNVYPEVEIDGAVYRFAPGIRVYDTYNRIIMPTQMPQSGKVYYQLDPGGLLLKMWLPTPDEEAGMGR